MTDELCECGAPKGHAPPKYRAPSYIIEYDDGSKVHVSVAARWGDRHLYGGMPEVGSREPVVTIEAASAENKSTREPKPGRPDKRASKRKTKAPKVPEVPEGQGSLL